MSRRWTPDDAPTLADLAGPGKPHLGWRPDEIAGATRRAPPPPDRGRQTTWLLAIIAALAGLVAFWVIATPHEQCYISDGSLFAVERPIERTGPSTYRGIPSELQADGFISRDAVITCRWELGQPYRVVSLFGG